MKRFLETFWLVVLIIALAITVLLMSGCTQINSLAVEDGENAMACIKGTSGATAGLFAGDVSGVTVEVPSTVDTSAWTADDWATLAEICD